MPVQYIVTGGAGFIGRNLVAALNDRGHEDILIIDSLGSDQKWKNLLGLSFVDILDLDDFRNFIADSAIDELETVFPPGSLQRHNGTGRRLPAGQQLPLFPGSLPMVPFQRRALHLRFQRGHLWGRIPGLLG